MHTILHNEIIFGALQRVKAWAARGYFDGKTMQGYFADCTWYLQAYDCILIFTRDQGMHSCGWMKNPDYERCWHLSLSFAGGRNKKATEKIIDGLFGKDKNKLRIESPKTPQGKSKDVWHYRLYCDQFWQPMIPKGEPYSTERTEIDWKSFSEQNQSRL